MKKRLQRTNLDFYNIYYIINIVNSQKKNVNLRLLSMTIFQLQATFTTKMVVVGNNKHE
jgi:hypothetical protein